MNELGEIRPSQLMFTFGVGALIDLPNMSALVMGLDDWDTRYCGELVEDRLVAAIQRRVGMQMRALYLPPTKLEGQKNDPATPAIGVPVVPFPRWMRCSMCNTLATVESGVFKLKQDSWRPDRTMYVHQGCSSASSPPLALPVRFLMACREGHLTDFPWVNFVHKGNVACSTPQLKLSEFGISGDASDIEVRCVCGARRRMADAFEHDAKSKFICTGHHPHLRMVDPKGCKEEGKPILLGASNSWFGVVLSALSIPQAVDYLGKLIEEQWADLKDLEEVSELKFLRKNIQKFQSLIPLLSEFNDQEIWQGMEAKRQGATQKKELIADLKLPEWDVFSKPHTAKEGVDFKLKKVSAPQGLEVFFEDTVLVERIREVRALVGFTRIESNADFAEATQLHDGRLSRLSRESPTWLPASEVRGEGIFIRLKEDVVAKWEQRPDVKKLEQAFFSSHKVWRKLRNLDPVDEGFAGIRMVLLHSLAHALMRQIVLDCGYTSASVRERLYCRREGDEGGPMAGILIYTAASDSEGTLGGLVELGDPFTLGRHLQQALESMRLCASDPLCAEHQPSIDGRGIHGACCHACLFAPETSCESGNRYLDRTVLVETFASRGVGFFEHDDS